MALNSSVVQTLALVVLASGTCLAYYGDGYNYRRFIVRKELQDEVEEVDCPVCTENPFSLIKYEEEKCQDNKKICRLGTYVNSKCHSRMDCLRGEGEPCTENLMKDDYGWRCAAGFVCDRMSGTCSRDHTKSIFYNNNHWYPLRSPRYFD